MPQQVPGKSLPAGPDKEKQDELDVLKLLYQNQPGYLEQYQQFQQRHPTLDMNLEILSGLHPVLETIKRAPDIANTARVIGEKYKSGTLLSDMQESAAANRARFLADLSEPPEPKSREEWLQAPSRDEIDEQVHKYLGALVAPEHRNPKKRELSAKIRPVLNDPKALNKVVEQDIALPAMQEWAKVIREQGRNGPYVVPAYRGGRGAVVPGRGKFYSPNPRFATRFVDPKNRGMEPGEVDVGPPAHHEYVRALKAIDAEELELRKPFVHRQTTGRDPNWTPYEEVTDLVNALGLGNKETDTLIKLAENHYFPDPNKVRPRPTETEGKVFKNESDMLKYERYITSLAKARGYDSIIRYSPETPWWELIKINE